MNVSSQACWLTGAGRSAVAVIALRGPAVLAALQESFSPRTSGSLESAKPGAVLFGQWANGEEVVVCLAANQWEIHCHGGVAAAPHILNDLQLHDVEIVDARQWEVSPRESETVNLAWLQLARAKTARTAAILLDQAQGAWDAQARLIEQWLSDSDRHNVRDVASASLARAAAAVEQLRRWADVGRRLDQPWRVALFGAPNAGKSTLINRIVGFQRSVVYRQAGTTRDLVTSVTVVDGWSFEFYDTAGLRHSDDTLEMAGAELTAAAVAEADLAVEIVDLTHPVAAHDLGVSVAPASMRLRVGNKSDLATAACDTTPLDLTISAETGEGVDQLLQRIVTICVPAAPPVGAAVPFAPVCFQQLERWESRLHGS